MSATERLQCVIVDDDARFAAAASKLLEGQGIEVLGVARYCAEALSMVEELGPMSRWSTQISGANAGSISPSSCTDDSQS
jgi:CheY-like chemotaxis protein